MAILKFGLGSLPALALAVAISATTVSPAASQSGGYFGQTATQNRDYSRMQSATNRAFRTEKITIKKKKMKHKHRKHKHKHKKHH
jgi:hypothetical protein